MSLESTAATLSSLSQIVETADSMITSLIPEDKHVRAFWLDGRMMSKPKGKMMLRSAILEGDQIKEEIVLDLSLEPIIDTWPPRSHASLYGNGSGKEEEIRKLMTDFASRAFRKPVSLEMVEPYVQMVLQQKDEPVVILPGRVVCMEGMKKNHRKVN